MDDIFARIGVCFTHLLNQSTVNGPAADEVRRLSNELQTFEGSINAIVDTRVGAAVEAIEGRIMSKLDERLSGLKTDITAEEDGRFEKLADTIERASGGSSIGTGGESTVAGGAGDDSVAGSAGGDSVIGPASEPGGDTILGPDTASGVGDTQVIVGGGASDVTE